MIFDAGETVTLFSQVCKPLITIVTLQCCTRALVSLIFQRQQHDGKGSFVYRLYGVVVHSGSLAGGHYTACVQMRSVDIKTTRTFLQKTFLDHEKMLKKEQLIKLVADDLPRERLPRTTHNDYGDDRWFKVDDSSVADIREEEVFRKEAYLLFYERLF